MVDRDIREFFVNELLDWFRIHRRDLPWRADRDPYRIWVSEIMLQQTRVDTVIPYYQRFMARFPTLEALADAPEDEVLKAWEGLGYYSRARNLQAAVREVKERYNGRVPDTPEEIASLKGIGPYTAGAILSIAYNVPEPAVDGNVMRVLSRFFLLRDDIARPATRKKMEALVRELIPRDAAGDFNQALMELGALVCTPRAPQCLTCPVMAQCRGRLAGEEEALPVKAKAKPPRPEKRLVALVVGRGPLAGKVLVRRRPDSGLLAGMWELPHVPEPATRRPPDDRWRMDRLQAAMRQEGIRITPVEWAMQVDHTFSHLKWELNVYRCEYEIDGDGANGGAAGPPLPPGYRWMGAAERTEAAFPNAFARILRRIDDGTVPVR
jgi:A/G-specific adenine glycosylase